MPPIPGAGRKRRGGGDGARRRVHSRWPLEDPCLKQKKEDSYQKYSLCNRHILNCADSEKESGNGGVDVPHFVGPSFFLQEIKGRTLTYSRLNIRTCFLPSLRGREKARSARHKRVGRKKKEGCRLRDCTDRVDGRRG